MSSIREQARQAVDDIILNWLKKNTGKWVTIMEVSSSLRLPIPSVTNSLLRLLAMKLVQRDCRSKPHNGKRFPIYMLPDYSLSDAGPSWFSPRPPAFASRQVLSIRFIESGKNKKGE